MFVKNLNIAYLLDFYGDVLSERIRDMLTMYYCDDLSLAEIADAVGISRQGVRQAIKKGEEELSHLEEMLGLAALHLIRKDGAEKLLKAVADAENEPSADHVAKLAETARAYAISILGDNQE